jgi:hypothetical protein
MAHFEGTIKEFTKFVGPYTRLKVAFMATKYKKQKGKCEDCDGTVNLDAAHVKGNERPLLIAKILSEFFEDDIVKINLEEFEQRFMDSHLPIETTIRILCKECHRKYDRKKKILSEMSEDLESIKETDLIEKLVNAQMNKSKAIKLASTKSGSRLMDSNTIYSNIVTAQNGWWLQPNNDKFKNELFMILHDDRSKKLYCFRIPANTITHSERHFNQRNDKYRSNCSNIYIPTSGILFKEKNGFDFSPYLFDTIFYE